jgi:hypothetical protein
MVDTKIDVSYECSVCKTSYATFEEAEECESKSALEFAVGSLVKVIGEEKYYSAVEGFPDFTEEFRKIGFLSEQDKVSNFIDKGMKDQTFKVLRAVRKEDSHDLRYLLIEHYKDEKALDLICKMYYIIAEDYDKGKMTEGLMEIFAPMVKDAKELDPGKFFLKYSKKYFLPAENVELIESEQVTEAVE